MGQELFNAFKNHNFCCIIIAQYNPDRCPLHFFEFTDHLPARTARSNCIGDGHSFGLRYTTMAKMEAFWALLWA